MKKVVILGSTGTIGRLALKVVQDWPDLFEVVGLAAGRNTKLLAEQTLAFRPAAVAMADKASALELKSMIGTQVKAEVVHGPEGLTGVAAMSEADVVLSAVVGFAGLPPTLAAVKAGKRIALANKESLVTAGSLVMEEAANSGATLLPVDSEHSAIFQSLAGHRREDLRRVILTASGGPFRKLPNEELAHVTARQALDHPNWDMGQRITIDSATLINKGFEAIEACWLFDLKPEQVNIQVHPQSIVHSAVEYIDGSVVAQLGVPDMRLPIAYALAYPKRLPLNGVPPLDLAGLGALTFEPPDMERFPCLALALKAGRIGQSAPAALNAADEVAVRAFLEKRIEFMDIARVIEEVLNAHQPVPLDSLETVLGVDVWARKKAGEAVASLSGQGGKG